MGLRIIDRHPSPKVAISEADRVNELTRETAFWPASHSAGEGAARERLIDTYRRVRARLDSPQQVAEMATRVRENILGRHGQSALSHNQVDVATLLELL